MSIEFTAEEAGVFPQPPFLPDDDVVFGYLGLVIGLLFVIGVLSRCS